MKRIDIINRIMKLTDEQFQEVLTLYLQQDEGSDPDGQALHRTSA